MRVICIGARLVGFERDDHAVTASIFLKKNPPAEPIVVVTHGFPSEGGSLDPALFKLDLRGVLLAQSTNPASPQELEDLKAKLKGKCGRVFGLTVGWGKLDEIDTRGRKKILGFLASEAASPADKDVRRWLGADAPYARLALRVALEIAHEMLEGRGVEAEITQRQLLEPVIRAAQADQSLAKAVKGIEQLLEGDKELLRQQVEYVLDGLRAEPA